MYWNYNYSYKLLDLFEWNLIRYSNKYYIVRRRDADKVPIIVLEGDFNTDIKSQRGQKFILFVCNIFIMELQNSKPNISTTRNNTTFDAIFAPYIEHL